MCGYVQFVPLKTPWLYELYICRNLRNSIRLIFDVFLFTGDRIACVQASLLVNVAHHGESEPSRPIVADCNDRRHVNKVELPLSG